jgi:hypothetical protein
LTPTTEPKITAIIKPTTIINLYLFFKAYLLY